MIRYYCSGFDINNAFGHGLGDFFKKEFKNTKSIVYIPAGEEKIVKTRDKYIPIFTEHFKNVGIIFETVNMITPDLSKEKAKELINDASFIMLLGGDPFKQKKMCEKLDIIDELKNYNGIMLGLSAGAMFMSKYIIITPCSEEYPDFHIEEGLNLDGISIYPHNNTPLEDYPFELISGDEVYKKGDLVKVAEEYGEYYLLQDYQREDGLTDVSAIKSVDGNIEYYVENDGRIWIASDDINIVHKNKKMK